MAQATMEQFVWWQSQKKWHAKREGAWHESQTKWYAEKMRHVPFNVIVSHTIALRTKELMQSITRNNALLSRLIRNK